MVPALTALTTPVPAATVATDVLLLLHVPPAVPVELYCAVLPVHIGVLPLTVPDVTLGVTVKLLLADELPQLLLTV